MASTFSPNLRIELIGAGEQSGAWNNTTNTNLGTLLEQAITGVQEITLTSGDYTLEAANGASDEARNMVLILGGSPGASRNIIAPDVDKVYIVRNTTGYAHTIKTASGTGVSIPANSSAIVFCDETSTGTFYNAVKDIAAGSTVNGAEIATVSGTQTLTNKTLTSPTINTPTISGGSISGITDLAIADGGTGASTASDARTNLGLGTLSTLSILPLGDIQDISTQRLLGRSTAATGEVEQITSSQALDFVGSTQGNILYRGASGWEVLAPGTAGQVLATGGASANPSWAAANSGSGVPDVIAWDQKTSGTGGGTAVLTTWTTRTLNTLYRNNNSIASLASNQITLPVGTYFIKARSPFYYTGGSFRIRLYNVTDSSVVQLGYNAYANAGSSPDRPNLFDASLDAVVTVSGSSKTFRIEYYVSSLQGSNTSNLGFPSSIGEEIYTSVNIWKL